jgi:CBS domain-containing protein
MRRRARSSFVLDPKDSRASVLTRRAVQIVQDMETDVLARISAAEIMDRGVHTVDESVTIRDAYERAIDTSQRALPIANQDRELVGVITQTDLNRAFEADHTDYPLGEYATRDIVTTFPEQLFSGAAFEFSEVNQLPVVERATAATSSACSPGKTC